MDFTSETYPKWMVILTYSDTACGKTCAPFACKNIFFKPVFLTIVNRFFFYVTVDFGAYLIKRFTLFFSSFFFPLCVIVINYIHLFLISCSDAYGLPISSELCTKFQTSFGIGTKYAQATNESTVIVYSDSCHTIEKVLTVSQLASSSCNLTDSNWKTYFPGSSYHVVIKNYPGIHKFQ